MSSTIGSPSSITTSVDLVAHLRGYLRVLNSRMWSSLGYYVCNKLSVNGQRHGVESLANRYPPGTVFRTETVVSDVSKRTIAARLEIELPPTSFGPGERVREHVFYHFNEAWKIDEVWSVAVTVDPPSPRPKASPAMPPVSRRSSTTAGSGRFPRESSTQVA